MKDVVDVNVNHAIEKIRSTDDVIRMINKGHVDQMCLLAHPNRWSDGFGAWVKELAWQNMKNVGKVILVKRSSFHAKNKK